MNENAASRPTVLLTNAIHPRLMPALEAACRVVIAPDTKADTLRRLVREANGLMVRAQLPPDLFDHSPSLRAVVRHGVGLDMIPVEAATARGIPVANLPGSNTVAVAEYCIAAMLELRRGLARIDMLLRRAGWPAARALTDSALELAGTTCGIVGVGAVGSRVATAAAGLGMKVLGLTRRPENLPAGVRAADRPTLFSEADVVVLSCPLNEQTRGLVDAAMLARMKPDAILINVARGPVIDTAAVLAALAAGRLGGAAMDVHDRQPLLPGDPVFDAPRLLLTPHVAGMTATSMLQMSQGAVDTMLALLRGERPHNVVNPEVYSR